MRFPKWLTRIRDAFNWGLFAYRFVVFLAATGVLGAISGGIWAVLIGVPLPIAIMAGYCTLVAAIFLALVPVAYGALTPRAMAATTAMSNKLPVDYKTWSHVELLSVSQASHLWSERDPGIAADDPAIDMWAQVMKDAIKRKELPVTLGDWADSGNIKWAILTPGPDTTVLRRDLIKFAKSKGWEPHFLRD